MSDIAAASPPGSGLFRRALASGGLALLVLIAAGDQLLFGFDLGLGLPIFMIAVATAIVVLYRAKLEFRRTATALTVSIACLVPLVEAPTFASFACAVVGLAIVTLVASGLYEGIVDLPIRVLRLAPLAPFLFFAAVARFIGRLSTTMVGRNLTRGVTIWVVPVVLALVFLALFTAANPLIELGLSKLDPATMLSAVSPGRIAFWIALAIVVWPLLRPRLATLPPLVDAPVEFVGPRRPSLLFGPEAILRALLVFNVMFAVQTVLDLTYLWGGTALPDGMTYANYAHRGAYPLIATALLAAAFVLAAMRPGGAAEGSRTIRLLVYLWIAQNVLLVISSIFRLWIYVEVYAFTELRVAAGIWMVLVATGLVLICLRIAMQRSNRWLISMNLYALGVVIWCTALIDMPAAISGFNVEHSFELTGGGETLHLDYLATLGPGVIPALDRYIAELPAIAGGQRTVAQQVRDNLRSEFTARTADWRSWTYRGARLDAYLAASGDWAPGK